MADKDSYVEEMKVWLDQQDVRILYSQKNIDSLQQGIETHQKLIELERQQASIIAARRDETRPNRSLTITL